jgi:hypothetical protein
MTEDEKEDKRKYKLFRNFMCNELGVTRQDIEAWTKQSVANEVEKKLGQMNVEQIALDTIKKAAREAIVGQHSYGANALREAVAKELAKELTFLVIQKTV